MSKILLLSLVTVLSFFLSACSNDTDSALDDTSVLASEATPTFVPTPTPMPTPTPTPMPTPTPTPVPTPTLEPETTPEPEQVPDSGSEYLSETDPIVSIRESVARLAETNLELAWFSAFASNSIMNPNNFSFDRASGGLVRIEYRHLINETTRYLFFEFSKWLIYLMQDTWLSNFDIILFAPRNATDVVNNNVFMSYYISISRESLENIDFINLGFYEFLALATEENLTSN